MRFAKSAYRVILHTLSGLTAFLLCRPQHFDPQNNRQSSTKTAVFLSYQPRCQRRQPLTTFPPVRSPAFSLCCPRPSARETAGSLQPRQPFFSQSTFVVRCESNEQLPAIGVAGPLDRPLFHSTVRSSQPAKRPPAFNQDGRFSLNQPLLFVAKATNNCPAIGAVPPAG